MLFNSLPFLYLFLPVTYLVFWKLHRDLASSDGRMLAAGACAWYFRSYSIWLSWGHSNTRTLLCLPAIGSCSPFIPTSVLPRLISSCRSESPSTHFIRLPTSSTVIAA